ncbi:hypothetical protein [Pseudorhodoplanes sp.]|uniref:hypothetical protein n=1 Tax=Pseudorhodoplanes sp. TaxID=1934341 RepID=UPI002C35043A|nr:hypothetical protein [Pseudorhodoplanes sp.]HWV52415.1 hypothetical protein [Pseudorhodoplanes sp.]
MLNIAAAIGLFAVFLGLLLAVRARDGKARIPSVWAAQGISLVLVCILMLAGGFVFRSLVD